LRKFWLPFFEKVTDGAAEEYRTSVECLGWLIGEFIRRLIGWVLSLAGVVIRLVVVLYCSDFLYLAVLLPNISDV